MSLNKFQSFCNNYRRDSFSDRVCDDLSEVILQFLPLKDKLRLECVTKQFQRTVFKRHNYLVIDEIRLCHKSVDFECLLKKLPNITGLYQKRFDLSCFDHGHIYLIHKYSHYLTEIHSSFKYDCLLNEQDTLSNTTIMEDVLSCKFRSKIVSIYVKTNDNKTLKSLQKLFPNVKQLNYLSFEWKRSPLVSGFYSFFIPFLEQICDLKNMNKISIQLYKNDCNQQMKDLQTFVENNRNITHLTILFDISDTTFAEFVFKQISNFKDLIELEIYEIHELSTGLKQIADNCLKLKSLTIGFITSDVLEIELILKQLICFKRLERLSINCIEYNSGIELILNETFRQMKDLTHLKIGFPVYPSILLEPTLLTDIDKHLPKLRHLFIRSSIQATEETADVLKRISRLESLVLFATNQTISDSIKTKVKTNCPKIRSIREMPF